MKLTDEQKRAAEAPGSVAVTAGAGTGKTRMLAHRFLHHVVADHFSPLSIVAVTFTDKAADELRSRIRKTIAKEITDERVVAEVDAAQISTMHALAARICRDFYDLAGIPGDFSIMDETQSPLWFAEKLEEAIAGIEPDVVRELGYTWLISAIEQLLQDPFAADEAFEKGLEDWQVAIEAIGVPALAEFKSTPAWLGAVALIDTMSGDEGDKLEAARRAASAAMSDIDRGENVAVAIKALADLKAGQGSAKAWPPGGKETMAACLKDLKETAALYLPTAGLQFGKPEQEVARRLNMLKPAYFYTRDFLRTEKLKEKLLDYTDLEYYALAILKHDEAIRHYAERWHAFLIDEFQDTNPVQAEILHRLASNAKRTIVGDEKQSIYGFRRADVEVFGRFRGTIEAEGGRVEKLDRTFRAHAHLVATMNTVFEPLLGELHQPLIAEREAAFAPGPFIILNAVEEANDVKRGQQVVEARHIAKQIRQMLDEQLPVHDGNGNARPIEPKDIAILSRTWEPLDTYLDALAAAGVPAVHAGGGSLLETREFKDAYGLLSFLADPNDDISLAAVLRSPFFAYSDKILYRFAKAMPDETSWWAVMKDEPGELTSAAGILSELLRLRPRQSAAALLMSADRMTGYRAILANLPHGARREADWHGTIAFLQKLERSGRGDVFGAARYFKQLIDAEVDFPRPPLDASQAVSLMTIHKSKGLEWPVVFVADLAKGRNNSDALLQIDTDLGIAFKLENEDGERVEPAIYSLIKQEKEAREIAETRRVLYVAITRAGERVFLTATKDGGPYLDLLRPGLEAAGILNTPIAYSAELAVPPAPGVPEPFGRPESEYTDPVHIGLKSLPVTALATFAECPLKFKFRFVDRHPGLGEGPAVATNIGTLTHKALELDHSEIESLRPFASGADDAQLYEAIQLASNFHTMAAFAPVRVEKTEREKRFTRDYCGITLNGAVDVVGSDFVLDYKTDSVADPAAHSYQLWAYARAFEKPRAFIAYLRTGVLHEFRSENLDAIQKDAEIILERMKSGYITASSSQKNCERCTYSAVCDDKYIDPNT